ncbi:MAG: site-2 protease family protein [Desulfovibrio sp.]|nr:site-2 protease family protein [Desulfovibrio sp.]
MPALFGIICHEVAHGWVAGKLGDPTARAMGRLTLNPLPHIDPVGMGVFALTSLSPSPVVFGWAKPVPVQPGYFRFPRQGMILVSLAGPMANLLVAILCAALIRLVLNLVTSGLTSLSILLTAVCISLALGTFINCALAWFNLLPLPPLDGGHILGGLLPGPLARAYNSVGRFGLLLVILLLATNLPGSILVPCIQATVAAIGFLTGLDPVILGQLARLRL